MKNKIKNESTLLIHIVALASKLADNQTKIHLFDNDNLSEEEEEQMYELDMDGSSIYTEEAQKIFNNLYDYFYHEILSCQVK